MKAISIRELTPFLFIFIIITSCTFRMGGARNEVVQGHYRLYSHPESEDEYNDETIKRIVIVNTNDMNGNLLTQSENTYSASTSKKMPYFLGGMEYFSTYLKILRSKYADQVLLLDTGNSLKGTLLTSSFEGEPTIKIFDYLGYDAIIYGTDDFNFQQSKGYKSKRNPLIENLSEKFAETDFKVLTSNLFDISKARPLNFGNASAHFIKEINGVKVGLLGLTSVNSINEHQKEIFNGVFIDNFKKSIFENSKLLRKKGAQVIVLLVNTHIECGHSIAQKKSLPIEKTNFKPKNSESCEVSEELKSALSELPKNVVDAIIAGGARNKVANFIGEIPVMQNFGSGKYFSRMELYFDIEKNKLLTKKTIIHQPTMICHNFFSDTEDCFTKDDSVDHDKIMPATFLGVPIQKDEIVSKLLEPYTLKTSQLSKKTIIKLPKELPHSSDYNSPFATFVVDTIRKKTDSKVGLVFEEAIKAGLSQGELTYGDLFKALPDDNNLIKVRLKGEVIKNVIRKSLLEDKYSNVYLSGLNIVIVSKKNQKLQDSNNQQTWEQQKDILVFLEDGSSLDLNAEYSVTTLSYNGNKANSSFNKILNKIHYKKKQYLKLNYRDVVLEEFKSTSVLNSIINKYNTTNRVILQDY